MMLVRNSDFREMSIKYENVLILESENMSHKEMIIILSDPCYCTQNKQTEKFNNYILFGGC